MTRSQFDPLAEAPRSFGASLARKFGRKIEPLAVHLLSWCRALDHRVESVEARLEADEGHIRSVAHAVRAIEPIVSRLEAIELMEARLAALEAMPHEVEAIRSVLGAVESAGRASRTSVAEKIRALEARTEQAHWGREALVDRMNRDDAREAQVIDRVTALEERAEVLYWGREALVERMNRDDAALDSIDRRLGSLQAKFDEQNPLPLAFGLDYLAMGRRLAALEDQVEFLLSGLTKTQNVRGATLVAFPAMIRGQSGEVQDKAVG